MPQRSYTPDQIYLLPQDPADWIDPNHPIRYIKAFVEGLGPEVWEALGVRPAAERGAARYSPKLLLSVWLGGFMAGYRSSREIERACREWLPFRMLSGGQTPDHNTLWRWYHNHRDQLRVLLRQTVLTAVEMEMVDLALQAVDGTKIVANARGTRMLTIPELTALEEKLAAAIADLEDRNTGAEDTPATLPDDLHEMQVLQEKVKAARKQVTDHGVQKVNLTDPDSRMMKTPGGANPAYNAQAVVAALDTEVTNCSGRIILGADVVQEGTDNHLLESMIEAARIDDTPVPVTVADAGYHSGETLAACAAADYQVVMPESRPPSKVDQPYHHDRFIYDPETDTVECPEGQTLHLFAKRADGSKRYRGDPAICTACPGYAQCYQGDKPDTVRMIRIDPHDELLRNHRQKMATTESEAISKQRKGLIEPVFGIMKERMGARRWLLRGLEGVQAEWTMLAVAFNLRTLAKVARYAVQPTGPDLGPGREPVPSLT